MSLAYSKENPVNNGSAVMSSQNPTNSKIGSQNMYSIRSPTSPSVRLKTPVERIGGSGLTLDMPDDAGRWRAA